MLAFRVEQSVFVGSIPPSQLETEIDACFSGPCYEALQTSLGTFNFDSFDQAIEAGRYGEIVADVSTRCGLDKRAARKKLQKISVAQHIKEGKPDASSWEQYAEEITTKAKEAEDRFVKGNLGLGGNIAGKYPQNSVIGFMDNIQEGNAGLLTAVRQYDYRLGLRFSTSATKWIHQAIRRAITGNQPLETADNVAALIPGLLRRYDRLTQELGRMPTTAEFAEDSELKEDVLADVMRAAQPNISLNGTVGDGDTELWEFVHDPNSSNGTGEAERRLDNDILRERLEKMADCLTPVERAALFAEYGVGLKKPLSYRKTGELLGITGQGADSARKRAMEKMREPDILEELEPYL